MLMRSFYVLFFSVAISTPFAANAKGGLGEIFGGLIGMATGKVSANAISDSQSIESALLKMADQFNAQMPVTVDRDTRLDGVRAGPGRRFTYNYTIVTANSRDIDRAYLMSNLQTKMKASVCSSADLKIFFMNRVTIGYSYRASDGAFVGNIDFTPRDCGYAT